MSSPFISDKLNELSRHVDRRLGPKNFHDIRADWLIFSELDLDQPYSWPE
jgi:hypothetical protein